MFIKMTGLDDNQVLHVDPKDIVYLQKQNTAENDLITVVVLGLLRKFQLKCTLESLVKSIDEYYASRPGVNPFVSFDHNLLINCQHVVGAIHNEEKNVVTLCLDGGVELTAGPLTRGHSADIITRIDDIKKGVA